ncbi:MAG: lipopolysaccharide heptosyltransferase II [Acidobacteriota bacterium]
MKILVRGTNWIGDAVMTEPAARRLRKLFPDDHLLLFSLQSTAGVFEGSEIFNDIIMIPESNGKALSAVNQAKFLRQFDLDLALILTNSFASAFVMRLAGVKRRIGYSTDGRGFLLTDRIQVPTWKGGRHEVFYYLNLISEAGRLFHKASAGTGFHTEPEFLVSLDRRSLARQFLSDTGILGDKPLVILAPGSTNSMAKRWPAEYFAELGSRIQAELSADVALAGGPDEKEISGQVNALMSGSAVDLTGRTSVAEAAAVLTVADVLVCNDMGLAHLAAAVGTRTLVIFGPTDPTTTRPLSGSAEVITANVECSPCMLRDCPIDHRCMTRVKPGAVFERIKAHLEGRNE